MLYLLENYRNTQQMVLANTEFGVQIKKHLYLIILYSAPNYYNNN